MRRQNRHITIACLLLGLGGALGSCGQLDPGQQVLRPWSPPPDPAAFARTIRPVLVNGCAAASCHGRPASWQISPALDVEPVPDELSDPFLLPQPQRDDYFATLAVCVADDPATSPLLLWGTGEVEQHPGGRALQLQQRTTIIQWLEGR